MDFALTAYALSDFSGFSAGINTSTVPDGFLGDTVTLALGAQSGTLSVNDDDDNFEDAFIETDNASTLSADASIPLAGGGTLDFPAGTRLENEFELTTDDDPPITLFIVRLGGDISNSGTNQLVLSSQPLTPGQVFNIAAGNDGASTPYDVVVCYARDTMIATPDGQTRVQSLDVGDLVSVGDDRAEQIRWIGNRRFTGKQIRANTNLAPVRIARNAFGPGTPSADLVVSQQHRVLLSGRQCELHFGARTFLASAISLVGMPGVSIDSTVDEIEYWHFLTDNHEIVTANGLPSETLFLGDTAASAMTAAQLDEIRLIFPDLFQRKLHSPAAPILKNHEASVVARSII